MTSFLTPVVIAALTQPFLLLAYANLLEVPQVLYLGQVLILALEGMHWDRVFLLTKDEVQRSVPCTVEFG
jgi:hypothetical protein